MAFDPDKYLKEKTAAPSFDPDAYLAQKVGAPQAAPEQPKLPDSEAADLADISEVESFIRSGVQIPTLGFADEALGGLHAALDVASGSSPSEFEKLYTTYRDMERRKNELAAKANPKTSIAGSLAGGVATAFVPGLNIASVPGAIGMGAAAGLGSSEADLLKGEYKDATKDTILGGITGGVFQKAANVIGSGVKGLTTSTKNAAKSATDEATKMGYKALGAGSKEFKELLEQRVRNQASDLPGVIEKYINPVGGPEKSLQQMASRIKEIEGLKAPLLQQGKEALESLSSDQMRQLSDNSITTELSNLAKKVAIEQKNIQGLDDKATQEIEDQVKRMLSGFLTPTELVPDATGRLVQQIKPKNPNDLIDLNSIKKALGKRLGDSGFRQAEQAGEGQIPIVNKAMLKATREAYDIVKNQITKTGDIIGGDLGTQIKNLNKEESLLIDLADLASSAGGKELASTGGGVGMGQAMSMGAAALGGATGMLLGGGMNPIAAGLGAGAGLMAKKALESHLGQGVEKALTAKSAQVLSKTGKVLTNVGNKLEAVEPALSAAGKIIQKQADAGLISSTAQSDPKDIINTFLPGQPVKTPWKTKEDTSNLATYNDEQLSGVSSALLNNPDEKLRSYGESLQKALQAGNIQGKNAAIFLIMQNPKARKQLGLTTRTFK